MSCCLMGIYPKMISRYAFQSPDCYAVRVIREFYSTYHSIRYVGKESVLRLEKELTDFQIDQLNEQLIL